MASTDAVASTDTVESESPQSAPPPPVSTGETQRALEALTSIEHSAQFVASDVAQLLGGLQASLHSVRTPQQYSIAFTYFPECLLPNHRLAHRARIAFLPILSSPTTRWTT